MGDETLHIGSPESGAVPDPEQPPQPPWITPSWALVGRCFLQSRDARFATPPSGKAGVLLSGVGPLLLQCERGRLIAPLDDDATLTFAAQRLAQGRQRGHPPPTDRPDHVSGHQFGISGG